MIRYYVIRVEDEGRVQCADITYQPIGHKGISVINDALSLSPDYSRGNTEPHENAADAIRATMPDADDPMADNIGMMPPKV